MKIENRIKELGLILPVAPKPIASYVPCVRAGNLLYLSGQLPTRDGKLIATGPVGAIITVEKAQEAARQCVLNALAVVKDALGGDWTNLDRVVRLGVFVQCDNGFTEQSKVANGASELLQEIFGEPGRHARSAVGVNALPLNASVEIDFVFQVE